MNTLDITRDNFSGPMVSLDTYLARVFSYLEQDLRMNYVRILRAQFRGVARIRTGRMSRSIKIVRVSQFHIQVKWVFYGSLVRNGLFKREAEKSWRAYLPFAIRKAVARAGPIPTQGET